MNKLTIREGRMMQLLVSYIWRYHKDNPDVGMGPSAASIVDEAVAQLNIKLYPDDYRRLVARVEQEEVRTV